MYGKVFAQMYRGSLYGSGFGVFAVWGWVIANCDQKGHIEINPRELASVLGGSRGEVEEALRFLESPDPESRTPDEDGRRLMREGQYLYRVVNFPKYRAILDEEARKEYQRRWDREHRPSGHARAKAADPAPAGEPTQSDSARHGPTQSDTVRHGPTNPTHTEAEAEAEAEEEETLTGLSSPAAPATAPDAAHKVVKAGLNPDHLAALWNRVTGGLLPKVSKLTEKRRRAAKARLAEVPDIETWEAAIRRLAASSFARGEKGGWVADFDFLLRPDTLVKVSEGRYDDRRPAPKPLPGAHYAKPAEVQSPATRTLQVPPPTPEGDANVWPTLVGDLASVVDERDITVWLRPVRQAGPVNGHLALVARSREAATFIRDEFLPTIADVAREHGIDVPIRLFSEDGEEVAA